jgi:hypothetical protein
MDTLLDLPQAIPQLFDPSFSVKVVEVAKKYNEPDVSSPRLRLQRRELKAG